MGLRSSGVYVSGSICSQFTRLGDLDGSFGAITTSRRCLLNLLDHIVTVDDLAEHNVFAVKKSRICGGDEELGAYQKRKHISAKE